MHILPGQVLLGNLVLVELGRRGLVLLTAALGGAGVAWLKGSAAGGVHSQPRELGAPGRWFWRSVSWDLGLFYWHLMAGVLPGEHRWQGRGAAGAVSSCPEAEAEAGERNVCVPFLPLSCRFVCTSHADTQEFTRGF